MIESTIILGDDIQEIELPELIPSPDCGIEYEISSVNLSPIGTLPNMAPLAKFLNYDSDDKTFLLVNQTDFNLIGV